MSLRDALTTGALAPMAAYKRFIVYRLEWLAEKAKWNKVPVSYRTGANTGINDPAIQTDAATAIAVSESWGKDYGVGFVFNEADGFFFLDIDKCRQGDRWSDLANVLLAAFPGAAIEVSVSGQGLHVFGRGTIPGHSSKNVPLGIELYHSDRFVALTGINVIGNAATDCTAGLAWLVSNYFPPSQAETFIWTDLKVPESEDKALIDRMMIAKSRGAMFGSKASFADLWHRKIDVLKRCYPGNSTDQEYDASSVDMAFAQHLAFWTRKDCQRMWRIMWQSQLRRPKWDDRPEYVRDTIIAAASRQQEVLADPIKPSATPPAPTTIVLDANANQPVVYKGRTPFSIHLTTDQANSKRIHAKYGDRIMSSTGKWFGWDGFRWADDMGVVWECAQQLTQLVKDESNDWKAKAEAKRQAEDPSNGFEEDEIAAALTKYAPKCESRETKNAALGELVNLCAVPPEALDADQWALNCFSGIIDLRSGSIRPHDPTARLTKVSPVHYDPTALCPRFEEFLAQIMREDTLPIEKRHKCHFLRRWFGYCATGSVREQKFAVHWGHGSNGKSTLIDMIGMILGNDYAAESAPGMMTGKEDGGHPTSIADLRGRRMVTSSESREEEVLKEDFIKRATGGDKLKGRHMRQDFFEFYPTHKIQLLTNHRPRIMGTDFAIWRRVLLIPYEETFGNKEQVAKGLANRLKDEKLLEALKIERQGILNWIVRGAVEWNEQGLNPPEDVQAATESYRMLQDTIAQFVAEQCQVGDATFNIALQGAGFSDCLYPRYQKWAKAVGSRPFGERRFLEEIRRVVPAARVATEQRKSEVGERMITVRMLYGIR